MSTVDVIVISFNRKHELMECVDNVLQWRRDINQLIIVDNHSTDGTAEWLNSICDEKIQVVLSNTNLGVAGGRNVGISKSVADILVFIDDDAIFECSFNPIAYIKQVFQDNNKLGIVAFKVVNFFSRTVHANEFPFTNKKISHDIARKSAYYVGAGHAIKSEVFATCGLYPEDFFYGKEELDLSLRSIISGYELYYTPSVVVLHKQAISGRMPNNKKWEQMYRNRLIISYKFYPFFLAVIANIVWFIKIAILSKSIIPPINGVKKFVYWKHTQKKSFCVMSQDNIKYIKDNYGRLYY